MMFFELAMSAFLLFIGIYGLISTFKMTKKSQKELTGSNESVLLSILPYWLAKLLLFVLFLIPLLIVTAMWLQKYGIID